MREIKFRAWDLISKKMVQVIHFYNHNDVYPDYIFMQYTGLKDANGKEIYEGDIVRYMDSLYYKTIHQIVWNDNFACFSYKPYKFTDNGGDDDVTLSYIHKFEVIGNIYEDSHLLDNELLGENK